jgi:hypothetical protein
MNTEIIKNFLNLNDRNDNFSCKNCKEIIQFYGDTNIAMAEYNLSCHLMRCEEYQRILE